MDNAKRDENFVPTLLGVSNVDGATPVPIYADPITHRLLVDLPGGSGSVTSVSVVSANGFAGTVATPTSTPAITLSTTVTGILYGDGTSVSALTIGSGLQLIGSTLSTTGGGSGTVTSVAMSVPTGLTVTGSPITTTGTLAVALDTGYVIPLSSTLATYVVGPASAVADSIAVYNGTTGKLIKDGGALIDTAATASTVVKRDADTNIYVNNYFAKLTSTVSAGGTTVLTAASSRTQTLTGASSQTFQLPDATTLPLSSIFTFNNNSSSSLIITNAGASTLYTVPAGGSVNVFVTANGTANGSWDFHAEAPSSVTWSSGIVGLVMNSVLTTSPSIGSGASSATAPSFIPQRGANTTGFGGDGTNLFATIGGTAYLRIAANSISPNANDATALGTTALMWSDLFLASGGVINFNNGNYTLTHSAGLLTANGAFSIGTANALTAGTIELGNTSDTTISRSAAGVIAVEGVVIPSISSTNTLTNKRITKRVGSTTSSATPTINTDNVDAYHLTAQTVDITSFTTNLSGTPTDFQQLRISVTGTAARAITWGASFANGPVALPTTTVTTTRLDVLLEWDSVTSKWRCMASGSTV